MKLRDIVFSFLWLVSATEFVISEEDTSACLCMDYWECTGRKGQVYSYCGISDNEVCCFLTPRQNQPRLSEETTELEVEGPLVTQSVTEPDSLDDFGTTEASSKAFGICGSPSVPVKLDSKADFREWPWHIAILEVTEDLYICGGALVSNDKIITAAHCLSTYTKNAPRLKIRAGEYDVSGNDEPDPHVEVLIETINIHPEFNNASLANDIAIVGLTRPINFTSNIRPLCLPLNEEVKQPGLQCVVTGWGRSSEDSNHSIVLKEVLAPLWTNENCERRLRQNFGSNYKLPSTAVCAGDEGTNGAICDGDGGGPLVCLLEEDGKWYQEGIVSFGIGCGRADSPGVYTRVSSYLLWIRNFVH